tara:strand:- start:4532 stop:4762 length:231 start_codon:yes stop_codon:yes gene_type:complete
MEILDKIMAPLDKEYCMYFYFSGLLALLAAVFAAVSIIPCMMDKKKKHMCIHLVLLTVQMGMGYLVNRLLYNMCIN